VTANAITNNKKAIGEISLAIWRVNAGFRITSAALLVKGVCGSA